MRRAIRKGGFSVNRSLGAKASIRGPVGRAQSAIVAGLAFTAVLHVAPAVASSQFASGPFTLPEGITTGLGGTYILSDADNDEVYSIPAGGGTVTSGTPMNFRVFGEIALPSGYAQSGQYFAYGTDGASVGGVAALTGTSGLGAPNPVIGTANGWFTDAAVAPTNFGSIRAGQVVLGNDPGGVGSAIPSTIDILGSDSASLTTFATLPTGVGAFGVGFAPTTFGADAGDLFVSDVGTGNLYVLNAAGQASLFANLPCRSALLSPVSGNSPGRPRGSPFLTGKTWAATCSSRLRRRMAAGDRAARSTCSTRRATRSRTTFKAAAPRRSIHADSSS